MKVKDSGCGKKCLLKHKDARGPSNLDVDTKWAINMTEAL